MVLILHEKQKLVLHLTLSLLDFVEKLHAVVEVPVQLLHEVAVPLVQEFFLCLALSLKLSQFLFALISLHALSVLALDLLHLLV